MKKSVRLVHAGSQVDPVEVPQGVLIGIVDRDDRIVLVPEPVSVAVNQPTDLGASVGVVDRRPHLELPQL